MHLLREYPLQVCYFLPQNCICLPLLLQLFHAVLQQILQLLVLLHVDALALLLELSRLLCQLHAVALFFGQFLLKVLDLLLQLLLKGHELPHVSGADLILDLFVSLHVPDLLLEFLLGPLGLGLEDQTFAFEGVNFLLKHVLLGLNDVLETLGLSQGKANALLLLKLVITHTGVDLILTFVQPLLQIDYLLLQLLYKLV